MATLASLSSYERDAALAELRAGQKRGHWVWWLFPTLAARGGDMNSARMAPGPSGADLADADEAVAYLQNSQLRSGLLAALNAVDCAMSAAVPRRRAGARSRLRPHGRRRVGERSRRLVQGLVLGGALRGGGAQAHAADAEVRAAAIGVLRHFKGDVVYTSGGRGTAGGPTPRYVLGPAPDEGTPRSSAASSGATCSRPRRRSRQRAAPGAPPPAIEPSPAPEPERDAPTPQARGDLPPRLAPPPPPLAPPPRRRGLLPPPQAVPSSPSLCAVLLCAVCRRRARRKTRLLSSSRSDGVEVADI